MTASFGGSFSNDQIEMSENEEGPWVPMTQPALRWVRIKPDEWSKAQLKSLDESLGITPAMLAAGSHVVVEGYGVVGADVAPDLARAVAD